MSESTTAVAPKVKADKPAKADKDVKVGGVNGKPEQKRLKIEDIKRLASFQVRGSTSEQRAEALAEVLKTEDLPRPKVIQVDSFPNHGVDKGPYFLLFDGFHTTRAHEINGKSSVECDVWIGTYQDGVIAAAKANQEWDKQGVPRSNADKARAVQLFARAFPSDAPKSELPSNRQIAELLGVSRQFVNNVDPFGRNANGRSHEDVKAQKRIATKANKGSEPMPAAADPADGKTFVFTSKGTNSVLGSIVAKSSDDAIAICTEIHPTWVASPFTCKEQKDAKPGAEVRGPGHDYGRLETALGGLIREWDAATGAAGVRGKPEGLAGVRLLDEVAAVVEKFVLKHRPKVK